MRTWDIQVLYLGKLSVPDSWIWPSGIPAPEDYTRDSPHHQPLLAFLLKSEGRNILVDSGMSDRFFADWQTKGWALEGGRACLENALQKEGLRPADIDTVVYTHLHNDHAGNCTLFPRARIIIQKEGWEALLNPLPLQRMSFDLGIIPELSSMNPFMVDGDLELADGIRLLKTPGHVRGDQSIAVNMKKGTVVLMGDLCLTYTGVFPRLGKTVDMYGREYTLPRASPHLGPALPTAAISDLYAFYSSIHKVKAVASRDEPGFIIPGHEASLLFTGI